MNIHPVLQHSQQLGHNDKLSICDLTTKFCWLLGICGFLRPSDIERIDLDQCSCPVDDPLTLLVVAPKENRQDARITKPVVIQRHHNTLYCPVAAYTSYIQKIASQPCYQPHPVSIFCHDQPSHSRPTGHYSTHRVTTYKQAYTLH